MVNNNDKKECALNERLLFSCQRTHLLHVKRLLSSTEERRNALGVSLRP